MKIIKIEIDFYYNRSKFIKKRLRKIIKMSYNKIISIKVFILIIFYINLRRFFLKITIIKYKIITINIIII